MANVHPITPQTSGEAVKRLTARLRSAFEAGEDIGLRAPHIHALAETLERTLVDLDRKVRSLSEILSPHEVDMLLRDSGLETMREQLKRLIVNARSFPVVERA